MKTDLELAESHKYKLPNGEIAVNVTAISGLMDDGKSGAMAGSAAKITTKGGDYRAEWREKMNRGTRVHGHCESFLRGESINCAESDKGFVDALEKFIVELDPFVLELESIVLSAVPGYGGRFDMIVRIAGETWLIDLKTGREYPIEHTLQLAAYRYANGIAKYSGTGSLVSMRPMPEIDHCACLYVREDGTYKLAEYPADTHAYQIFCALLCAYKWTRNETMKELVKEARKAI